MNGSRAEEDDRIKDVLLVDRATHELALAEAIFHHCKDHPGMTFDGY